MTTAEQLGLAPSCSLIAPAGTGKSRLIVDAVASRNDGKDLILTHTHAGIDVLRRRLREARIPTHRYRIDTIAGWCLQIASSFPKTSGFLESMAVENDWLRIYQGTAAVLKISNMQDVLRCSYTSCYVDEGQDCDCDQFSVISLISSVIPVRMLGDPLQGIFGFRVAGSIEWPTHVVPAFPAYPGLTKPWRWEKNKTLAKFVVKLRADLISGRPINLIDPAIKFTKITPANAEPLSISACFHAANLDGTVVAIREHPAQCHRLSSRLRGSYSCIEPIEVADLIEYAREIDRTSGLERVQVVLNFAARCFTSTTTELKPILSAMQSGRRARRPGTKWAEIMALLWNVAELPGYLPTARVINAISQMQGSYLHRHELYFTMDAAINLANDEISLEEAVRSVRDRDRHRGRRPRRLSVGRTLLVKGLEFHHAIVMDVENMDAAHLYVALTRATDTLTVLAQAPILSPRCVPGHIAKAISEGLLAP